MIPFFAELCAGTAALSLRLQGGRNARPPVSRMGNKQGYGEAIFRTLGLRSGSGAARYLWCEPDPGCRLLLLSYTDADLRSKAAEIIRGWRDEEPRALWERLRAEGPVKAPEPREVARWVTVTGNCAFNGDPWRSHETGGRASFDSIHGDGQGRNIGNFARTLSTLPTLPATVTDDAREVDPREVARWMRIVTSNRLIPVHYDRGRWCNSARNTGKNGRLSFGGDDFCTPIESLASAAETLPTLPATVTDDARPLQPARLPPGSIVYIDPPYVGTTGYGHDLTREEVCTLAERWASAGALVVISEAEPLTELSGWHQVEITGERKGQKRTFSKQQREYLTMSSPPKWRPAQQHTLFSMAAK